MRDTWTILEHRTVPRDVARMPEKIRKKYEAWKALVVAGGPECLRRVRGFSDEALAGKWDGYRSSRLDLAYRVVYRVSGKELLVIVERVSKHDYS